MIRCWWNKIDTLMVKEGRWVEGKEELKNMVGEFYSQLFSSDVVENKEFIKGHFPCMEQEQKTIWEMELLVAETKKSLSEMGFWKAPGPDGY